MAQASFEPGTSRSERHTGAALIVKSINYSSQFFITTEVMKNAMKYLKCFREQYHSAWIMGYEVDSWCPIVIGKCSCPLIVKLVCCEHTMSIPSTEAWNVCSTLWSAAYSRSNLSSAGRLRNFSQKRWRLPRKFGWTYSMPGAGNSSISS